MKLAIRSLVAAATLIAAAAAQAQVTVKDAWVRATVPQQKATGAFMQLQSTKDTKLVSASSPLTPNVEVHEMAMQNNVMKMRAVPAIELPAQAELRMMHGSADGYHLMLINLKQPLKDGDRFSVWLQFKNSGEREVTVHVQTPKSSAPAHNH
jgi:copper(I)-binding protein